jgi:hypothetical protein
MFTYHGYGTWLPDHRRGYVRRNQGIQPRDTHMADLYRRNMTESAAMFGEEIQRHLIEGSIESCGCQAVRCHFVATESTHVHVLASWSTDRTWELVRRQIGGSLTRRLNREINRRQWFVKSPSRKRVRDFGHFQYLVTDYLPKKHRGLKWCEGIGMLAGPKAPTYKVTSAGDA